MVYTYTINVTPPSRLQRKHSSRTSLSFFYQRVQITIDVPFPLKLPRRTSGVGTHTTQGQGTTSSNIAMTSPVVHVLAARTWSQRIIGQNSLTITNLLGQISRVRPQTTLRKVERGRKLPWPSPLTLDFGRRSRKRLWGFNLMKRSRDARRTFLIPEGVRPLAKCEIALQNNFLKIRYSHR